MTNYHALVIEDDSNNSEILQELLNSESIVCTAIQDSRLVQSFMDKIAPPDVIFLDLEMPHVDGYEVLEVLKSNSDWESVPVVACTIHLNEVQTAKSKAFHSFIAKPLDMDSFPDQIRCILNNEPVWDVNRFR